jgi:hypothetical protein
MLQARFLVWRSNSSFAAPQCYVQCCCLLPPPSVCN